MTPVVPVTTPFLFSPGCATGFLAASFCSTAWGAGTAFCCCFSVMASRMAPPTLSDIFLARRFWPFREPSSEWARQVPPLIGEFEKKAFRVGPHRDFLVRRCDAVASNHVESIVGTTGVPSRLSTPKTEALNVVRGELADAWVWVWRKKTSTGASVGWSRLYPNFGRTGDIHRLAAVAIDGVDMSIDLRTKIGTDGAEQAECEDVRPRVRPLATTVYESCAGRTCKRSRSGSGSS